MVTLLAGAVIGAALVLHTHIIYPLVIAFGVIAIGAVTAWKLGSSDPAWVHAAS